MSCHTTSTSSRDAGGAHLRLEQITKSYGSRAVVRSLQLSVARGEFFTILGPSGSGKTTTLMLIAGFTAPTAGDIYIDDQPMGRVPPHERNIGVVFQNYGLFPHMTVGENVEFPLRLRGRPAAEIRERVEAMLEMVQLSAYRQHSPQQLSGGQQQRVALARALVFGPQVLLLDEPLGALDKNLREQMQIELKNLHRRLGATIICVTHDQAEALTLSDRIAVLNAGNVEQVDTPENLYERPRSRFVATFIGESNIIKGRLAEGSSERSKIVTADGLTFAARPANSCPVGTPAELIVRPQHVLLGAEASRADNSLPGIVTHRLYSGDCLRLGIELSPALSIVAQVPNSRLPNSRLDADLAPGDRITVAFSPENTLLFTAHGAQPDEPHASL